MLIICRHCGEFFEVVDEEDERRGCPFCLERKRKAEERSRRLEELRAIRVEKARELDDPIQLSDNLFTMLSGSDQNKSYTVKREGDHWTCDCPDFRYRKYEQLDCKHIEKVKESLKRQAEKHKAEARAKIRANRKVVYAEAGFYG